MTKYAFNKQRDTIGKRAYLTCSILLQNLSPIGLNAPKQGGSEIFSYSFTVDCMLKITKHNIKEHHKTSKQLFRTQLVLSSHLQHRIKNRRWGIFAGCRPICPADGDCCFLYQFCSVFFCVAYVICSFAVIFLG